jgi:hypothetical protein
MEKVIRPEPIKVPWTVVVLGAVVVSLLIIFGPDRSMKRAEATQPVIDPSEHKNVLETQSATLMEPFSMGVMVYRDSVQMPNTELYETIVVAGDRLIKTTTGKPFYKGQTGALRSVEYVSGNKTPDSAYYTFVPINHR